MIAIKVQKLSRHADPRTLMIYDDNRNKDLWEMSELLTGMLKDMEEDATKRFKNFGKN
jgi:integrase/recombinase XerC